MTLGALKAAKVGSQDSPSVEGLRAGDKRPLRKTDGRFQNAHRNACDLGDINSKLADIQPGKYSLLMSGFYLMPCVVGLKPRSAHRASARSTASCAESTSRLRRPGKGPVKSKLKPGDNRSGRRLDGHSENPCDPEQYARCVAGEADRGLQALESRRATIGEAKQKEMTGEHRANERQHVSARLLAPGSS